MNVKIDISGDAEAAVERLAEAVVSVGMRSRIGLEAVNLLQGHLEGLPPNRKFPGETTNFWKDAARQTHFQVTGDGVEVGINKLGFAQRYYGGPLRPVNAKNLTLPARAEAYGKTARDFANLRVIFGQGGRAVGLGVPDEGLKRRGGKTGVKGLGKTTAGAVMFWLVREVMQQGNPAIIPDEERIRSTAFAAIRAYREENP